MSAGAHTHTIVAMATPSGRGGVAIVRLSGPKARFIAAAIIHQDSFSPRKAQYVNFYDEHGEKIDHGIVIYFQAPHSFTGECVVELQCHGAPVVVDKLIRLSVHYGAEIARPGEFSERAFLNNKIDLVQAEAIADLIHAQTERAAKMAVRSLDGAFSQAIEALSEALITLRMYVESAIDFSDEDLDVLSDYGVATRMDALLQAMTTILQQASQGARLQEGIVVVIAGPPNVGKSTLLNTLAGQDLAIVTDIAGTTRDVMRAHIVIDDLPVHVLDTAGLRDTADVVEQEGVRRAWASIEKADLVLFMSDVHKMATMPAEIAALQQDIPPHIPVLSIINKVDLIKERYNYDDEDRVLISAHHGAGIAQLKQAIHRKVGFQLEEGIYLARRRHVEALQAAREELMIAHAVLAVGRACDVVAEHLRLAHQHVCAITGVFTSDDLLGKIFATFCIGK